MPDRLESGSSPLRLLVSLPWTYFFSLAAARRGRGANCDFLRVDLVSAHLQLPSLPPYWTSNNVEGRHLLARQCYAQLRAGSQACPLVDLELRDLRELELNRGLSTKDVDQHLEFELVFVDFDDLAREVRKWAFFDSDSFAFFVGQTWLGTTWGGFFAFDLDGEAVLYVFAR